jgi:hypothetical protein
METRTPPSLTAPGRVPDAVRVQILAAEHSSLLAARSLTLNEMLSRAGMFLTVLSGAVVALALVAQATAFGPTFRVFALLVLPVVLAVGVLTFLRLGDANAEERWLLVGMNRLRHGYLELAPELEPYFVTGHTDDEAGVWRTYSPGFHVGAGRVLAGTPALVALLDAVVAGVIAALIARTIGAPAAVAVAAAIAAAVTAAALLLTLSFRMIRRIRRDWVSRFPG